MKKIFVDCIIGFGCLVLIACVALLPATAPPNTEKIYKDVHISSLYEGEVCVWIMGEGVKKPGMYRMPYGSTYGDLFTLAEADCSTIYNPADKIAFTDVVLIDGEYCIYLVI